MRDVAVPQAVTPLMKAHSAIVDRSRGAIHRSSSLRDDDGATRDTHDDDDTGEKR